MTWWAVGVRARPEHRDRLGAWLVGRTGQAIEERPDGTLVAVTADEPAAAELAAALHDQFEDLGLELTRTPIEAVDWSTRWRDGLGARRFGRLTVMPSWTDAGHHADGPVVVLDPESAFGSGEHGSTRAALTLLERVVQPGHRVLDLGSGSGILAIAAVKLGAASAVGVDIDADANTVADRNADRNGVADAVEFVAGDAGVLAPLLGPADLLLANILRTANTALLPAIRAALRAGGIAIFSGMEESEAPLFRPALRAAELTVCHETVDAGWWAVAASPI